MMAILAILAIFDFGVLISPVFSGVYGKVANIAKVAMLAVLAILLATFAQVPGP